LEGFGEHGLTTTGSADHEDIVKSCCCDHESTLGGELTLDMAEITEVLGGLVDSL
jgi:hypothetical protein